LGGDVVVGALSGAFQAGQSCIAGGPQAYFICATGGAIVGGIIIVAGYFIAEYFVFDPGVAIASILTNTIQAVMSVIISMILYAILRKRLG